MEPIFVRPEALTAENGRYRNLLLEFRGWPYGIDASQEIMNVVEAHQADV